MRRVLTGENISLLIEECNVCLDTNSVPVKVRSIVNEIKSLVEVNQTKSLPPVPTINTSDSCKSLNSDENLLNLIVEQRRGNRLLEQVIAAINTTNALLAQLVQR